MKTSDKFSHFYSFLFLVTGIFAILGALYTWGAGPILEQTSLLNALIPWGDLLVTGPLSLIAGYGLMKRTGWSFILAAMTSGIYLFGSTLVIICLVWDKAYPIQLVLPPLAGLFIGIGYPIWLIRQSDPLLQVPGGRPAAVLSDPALEAASSGEQAPVVAAFSPHPVQQPEI